MSLMVDRTPAEHLGRFPELLQSSLAIAAFTVIDATHDERSKMRRILERMLAAPILTPATTHYLRATLGIVQAVEHQAATQAMQNTIEAPGFIDDREP